VDDNTLVVDTGGGGTVGGFVVFLDVRVFLSLDTARSTGGNASSCEILSSTASKCWLGSALVSWAGEKGVDVVSRCPKNFTTIG
jgi:hypothetical protein